MPQVGEPVAASTARIAKAAAPPCWRVGVRMSCVVGQKLGRNKPAVSVESSVRYSASSSRVLRQVKYVYDCWNPIMARVRIIAGRVNASDKKMTSGEAEPTSAMIRSQNGSGLVCGL